MPMIAPKYDTRRPARRDRVKLRPELLATLRERLASRSAAELADIFERAGLPFAPIRRPEDLLDDPHLLATGGLTDIELPDGSDAGRRVKTTLFPVMMDGERLGVRLQPPRFGAHTAELLNGLGYATADIDDLKTRAVVA